MTAVEVVVVWILCVINLLATKFLESTTRKTHQAAAQKRERNKAATRRARGAASWLAMEQGLPLSDSDEQAHVGTNQENLRRRDPNKLRDLLTPLLDLDEDAADLKNLDKMLADRFAQFTERRKQLLAMKNENEREIVIKLLEQEEASRANWSLKEEEHEEGASDVLQNEELKHLKDE